MFSSTTSDVRGGHSDRPHDQDDRFDCAEILVRVARQNQPKNDARNSGERHVSNVRAESDARHDPADDSAVASPGGGLVDLYVRCSVGGDTGS